jgi:hypothetical protein
MPEKCQGHEIQQPGAYDSVKCQGHEIQQPGASSPRSVKRKNGLCRSPILNRTLRLFPLILALALNATAQIGQDSIVFDDFIMRGNEENGDKSWQLHGEHAQMNGSIVKIDGLDVYFYMANGSATRVQSPNCKFNKTTRIGASPAPIHVEGDNMKLDGIGYDLLADQQKLIVRSKVQMWIRQTDNTPLSTENETPAEAVEDRKHHEKQN